MGNIQFKKQKKGLLEEKDAEQPRLKNEEIMLNSSLPYKSKNIIAYSSSVDPPSFCFSNSSQSSACLPVKNTLQQAQEPAPSSSKILNTCHEQLFSGPSEEMCEHTGAHKKAKSTSHQTLASVTPPLFTFLPPDCPIMGPESACQPPTPPRFSVPTDTCAQSVLPGTVQLEKTVHSLKETKTATVTVSLSSTSPSQSQEIPAIPLSTTVQNLAKCGCDNGTDLQLFSLLPQTDLKNEFAKEQEMLPDTKLQPDVRSVLNGVPHETAVKGAPPEVSLVCREKKTKQIARKAKMNNLMYKKPSQLEYSQPAVTTPPQSIIPTKTSTNHMPVGVKKQTAERTKSQNDLSVTRPVSYKNGDASAAAAPIKSFEPSESQSTAHVSQTSEDCTAEDVVVFVNFTSEIDMERPQRDTAEDSPNILTALHFQTKRQHSPNTKKRMTTKAEVIKEVKIEKDLSPSELPSHPEGRWHPFTTNLRCTCKVRCAHRSNALLPHNVRRWHNMEHNYLCEPPWVTTASLAASLAFRMRQEKDYFCL